MSISVRHRMKPFSHQPGTSCVLPSSQHCFTLYPSRIEVGSEVIEVPITPSFDFTIEQNLEKGILRVWGGKETSYYRYRIQAEGNNWSIFPEKGLDHWEHPKISHEKKEAPYLDLSRLFLGCHKEQSMERMRKRASMEEILPFWHRLGILTAKSPASDLFAKGDYEELAHLYRIAFSDLLVPHSEDIYHWGFPLPTFSPFSLLSEGAECIEQMFLSSEKGKLSILPSCPHQFDRGKGVGFPFEGGKIHFEWSRKRLRQVILQVEKEVSVLLEIPLSLKRYRLNKKTICLRGDTLDLKPGLIYHLDRFEK